MFKIRNGLIAAAAAVGFAASGFAASAQELVVGAAGNPGGLAVFVAQDKGFFAKNGVDVKVEIRNTGSELSKGLRAGDIRLCPGRFHQSAGRPRAWSRRSRYRRLCRRRVREDHGR